MTWLETKELIFSEGSTCQVWRNGAECGAVATQPDHAIFSGKQRNSRVRKAEKDWLNSPFNAQRACRECNVDTKRADHIGAVEFHIRRKIEEDRTGFIDWYYSAPDAVSRLPGSDWQVKSIIVKRCLNEN